MRYVVRELNDRQALTVLETVGDTPVRAVFDTTLDSEFGHELPLAVTLTSDPANAERIAAALNAS